jgi:hypothetical protein
VWVNSTIYNDDVRGEKEIDNERWRSFMMLFLFIRTIVRKSTKILLRYFEKRKKHVNIRSIMTKIQLFKSLRTFYLRKNHT